MTFLQEIGNALSQLGVNTYHYWRPQMQPPFIVWAEDGEEDSFEADDKKHEVLMRGYVDYYTLYEYDDTVEKISALLNTIDRLHFRYESVQYEEETNLIHHEWRFFIFGTL